MGGFGLLSFAHILCDPLEIAIVKQLMTCHRHSRFHGNPWVALP